MHVWPQTIQKIVVGDCTIELTPESGGEKVNFDISCPSCAAIEGEFDVDDCDIYSDLELETSKKYWRLKCPTVSRRSITHYPDCTDCTKRYILQDEGNVSNSMRKYNTTAALSSVCMPTLRVQQSRTTTVQDCPTTTTVDVGDSGLCSALGAAVGILGVLLCVTTTGWIRTYWVLKSSKINIRLVTVTTTDACAYWTLTDYTLHSIVSEWHCMSQVNTSWDSIQYCWSSSGPRKEDMLVYSLPNGTQFDTFTHNLFSIRKFTTFYDPNSIQWWKQCSPRDWRTH